MKPVSNNKNLPRTLQVVFRREADSFQNIAKRYKRTPSIICRVMPHDRTPFVTGVTVFHKDDSNTVTIQCALITRQHVIECYQFCLELIYRTIRHVFICR